MIETIITSNLGLELVFEEFQFQDYQNEATLACGTKFNNSFFNYCTVKSDNKFKFFKRYNRNIINQNFKPIEISHHNILNQPGFLTLEKGIKDKNYIQFLYTYMETLPLEQYINNKSNLLNIHSITNLIFQITNIVHHLHSNGLMIRNLSPQSFLINPDTMRIVFVNLDCVVKIKDTTEPVNSNIIFSSPEFLNENTKYNESTDIWSLGILTYYLYTSKYPFKKKIVDKLAMKSYIETIQISDFKFTSIDCEQTQILKFIMDCLSIKKEKRPTIDILKNYNLILEYTNIFIKKLILEFSVGLNKLNSKTLKQQLIGQILSFYDKFRIMELFNCLDTSNKGINVKDLEKMFSDINKSDNFNIIQNMENQLNDLRVVFSCDNEILNIELFSVIFQTFDSSKLSLIETFMINMKQNKIFKTNLIPLSKLIEQIGSNLNPELIDRLTNQIEKFQGTESLVVDFLELLLIQNNHLTLNKLWELNFFKSQYKLVIENENSTLKKYTTLDIMKQFKKNISKRVEDRYETLLFIYHIKMNYPCYKYEIEWSKFIFSFGIINLIQLKREERLENLRSKNIFTEIRKNTSKYIKSSNQMQDKRKKSNGSDDLDIDDLKEKWNDQYKETPVRSINVSDQKLKVIALSVQSHKLESQQSGDLINVFKEYDQQTHSHEQDPIGARTYTSMKLNSVKY